MFESILLTPINEALCILLEGFDPVENKPLPCDSAGRDEAVRHCLHLASVFLTRDIQQDTSRPSFFLTPEQRESLSPLDRPLRMTELLQRFNQAAQYNVCLPLSGTELMSWLVKRELFLPFPDDNDIYSLAPDGEAAGIRIVQDEIPVTYYDPSAQQYIFQHLEDFLDHIRSGKARGFSPHVHKKLLDHAISGLVRLLVSTHPATGEPLSPEDPLCQKPLRECFMRAFAVLVWDSYLRQRNK